MSPLFVIRVNSQAPNSAEENCRPGRVKGGRGRRCPRLERRQGLGSFPLFSLFFFVYMYLLVAFPSVEMSSSRLIIREEEAWKGWRERRLTLDRQGREDLRRLFHLDREA